MGILSLFIKKKPAHILVGEAGEKIAVREMKKMGLEILRRNYSVHGVGEIDIIARDGSCLVFVEVKTRKTIVGPRPGEAVNYEKKKRLWKASRAYLRELGKPEIRYRFDVVEVLFRGFFKSAVLYLPNAFNIENIKRHRHPHRSNDSI